MIAVDTSVAVAAALAWHESHELARSALRRESISGGAVDDALVAATAEEARATLLTLDRLATETYRLLRIDYALLG